MSYLSELVPPPGPVRLLCMSNLAKTVGNGIMLAVTVLYFTRSVELSASEVALALTIGGVLGMLASVPAGHMADVLGPRATTIVFMCLQGAFLTCYAFVESFPLLVVAACLVLVTESATDAARGSLIAGIVPPDGRVKAWSYLRSVSNLGLSLGALAGGVALHFDEAAGYRGVLVAGGLLVFAAGLAYFRLPHVAPQPKEKDGPVWIVLRDLPYATVSVLNAVLTMNTVILNVGLPLWISQHTDAPTSTYSGLILLNSVTVVLLQVWASKGGDTVTGGARALRRSGLLLAACCAVFALATGRPAWLAVVILVAGAALHVLGEMMWSTGSWSLSFGLAPEHAQGQYQGLFGMSTQLGTMVTPALVTALVVGMGQTGWLLLGAALAAAGLLAPSAARWAQNSRRLAPAALSTET
ncbi:MFS transporter [Streptomyces sp. NPDC019396]|uniref:MFS transporter n=1 Tax=Streptomyces sp. NPDC019396 TaxID=3154687 RepID=UPI0033D6E855